MHTSIRFSALLWAMAVGFIFCTSAVAERRPNVIMIVTDDQGYGDLACHGHPFVKTPNLDRLHRESLRLTDFHVMPLCAPTRAALMTGRDPLRDGVWATVLGRSILPASTPTIADVFAANGYRTGMFGKWHLGDNAPARPRDKGFRHVFMHGGGGVGQTPDEWGNDYVDDTYRLDGEAIRTMGYCTDVWFAAASHFMKETKDQPFFVYLATNAPHSPFVPPPDLANAYRDIAGIDTMAAAFYAMIENIDTNLGKLLAQLEKENLARDTIVVFLTDNGTTMGNRAPGGFNAGMRGVKGNLYDGGHRVPCFIRWPGGGLPATKEGKDIGGLTIAQDLLPTLASLCGLSLKNHPVPLDGQDLGSILRGEKTIPDDRTSFVQFAQTDAPPSRGKAAVLSNRWRLVNSTELYDMKSDPGQKSNVAAEHPDIVASLKSSYDRWFDGLGDALSRDNPIHIGGAEEETRLNVMDLHTGGTPANLPWNQTMILKGPKVRGYWALETKQAGTYRIRCSRWPEESGMKLTDAPKDAMPWPIAKARLKLGEIERTIDLLPGDTYAEFDISLKTGLTRLQADFLDSEGREIGTAYYVGIRKR
ncbi:sulfatase-like hydrolase/transferase [bacterium]|nr:sulfatase-like hydrolase/transferase [bacterium]